MSKQKWRYWEKEGYRAYPSKKRTENPHPAGSAKAEEWDADWEEAFNDARHDAERASMLEPGE